MSEQIILSADNAYAGLDAYLKSTGVKSVFLVCGSSIRHIKGIFDYFESLEARLGIRVIYFSDFQPNPGYESVVRGAEVFRNSGGRHIVAVGGGSAMDIAKCIKLFSTMEPGLNYLEQEPTSNDVGLLAVPTTAGSGSEANRHAVIYYEGRKISISHESIIPDAVLFDPTVLKSLPEYQRKSTMLDALCHGLESFWSIKSTEESRRFSGEAIALIMNNMEAYLAGDSTAYGSMQRAAYLAGRAISIAQTTAGHAMCYRLTTMYGIAHGHAAALVNYSLWQWMLENIEGCIDPRGRDYLSSCFKELSLAMGGRTIEDGALRFREIFDSLGLGRPETVSDDDYPELIGSVNPERLGNNPVRLGTDDIDRLYHSILD